MINVLYTLFYRLKNLSKGLYIFFYIPFPLELSFISRFIIIEMPS